MLDGFTAITIVGHNFSVGGVVAISRYRCRVIAADRGGDVDDGDTYTEYAVFRISRTRCGGFGLAVGYKVLFRRGTPTGLSIAVFVRVMPKAGIFGDHPLAEFRLLDPPAVFWITTIMVEFQSTGWSIGTNDLDGECAIKAFAVRSNQAFGFGFAFLCFNGVGH